MNGNCNVFKLADYLNHCDTSREYKFIERKAGLPGDLVEETERLRKHFKGDDSLLEEQLSSLTGMFDDPCEQLCAQMGVLHAHFRAMPESMYA